MVIWALDALFVVIGDYLSSGGVIWGEFSKLWWGYLGLSGIIWALVGLSVVIIGYLSFDDVIWGYRRLSGLW